MKLKNVESFAKIDFQNLADLQNRKDDYKAGNETIVGVTCEKNNVGQTTYSLWLAREAE